jgi:hypothetical protein
MNQLYLFLLSVITDRAICPSQQHQRQCHHLSRRRVFFIDIVEIIKLLVHDVVYAFLT